jgi:Zn-dependent protease
MFLVARTRTGVPILVHWSVPALCLFLLGTGVSRILTTAATLAAYFAIFLIHELGHQVVAQRLLYRVEAIKIYPFHGKCLYEAPHSRWHRALVAWGGPLAQFIVAAPLAALVIVRGPTRIESIDAVLAILGFLSPVIAILNLIPLRPLDGSKAWWLIPLAWERIVYRKRRHSLTPMEAMEEALRKASKSRGA